MGWALAGAIGGQAIAGLLGQQAATDAYNKQSDKQRSLIKRMMSEIDAIELPDEEKMKLQLLIPDIVANYTPEEVEATLLKDSTLSSISTDPRLKEAQEQSLATISKMASGGLTEDELAALRQVRRQAAGSNEANQAAIVDEMAKRGMPGGGAELALRSQAASRAANAEAEAQDRITQAAMSRALQAAQAQGSMAGSQRTQEFQEKSTAAQAADEIDRQNWLASTEAQRINTQNRNEAARARELAKQEQENLRVQLLNEQQKYNKGLSQNTFNNALAKQQAKSGATTNLANLYGQQAQVNAGAAAAPYQAIGQGLGAIGQYSMLSGLLKKPAASQGTVTTQVQPAQAQYAEEELNWDQAANPMFTGSIMPGMRS